MIYLVCFCFSSVFAYKAYKAKSKGLCLLYSIVSILAPTFLAGMRDYNIGIDTSNYYTMDMYWYGAVKAKSLWTYLQAYLSQGNREVLFAIYLGVMAKIVGDYHVFLFVNHLIIVTGVYVGAFRQRKYVNPALVLMLFYLCFYNHSLNVTRQYIAMAIIFAFLADLEQKKYLRYLTIILLAMLIHNTACIAICPLIIHFVMFGKLPYFTWDLKKRKKIIILLFTYIVLGFLPLCKALISFGVLGKKYLYYISGTNIEYGGIVSFLLVLELVGVYLFREKIIDKSECMDYYVVSSIIYLILYQLTALMPFGKRIAGFFSINNLLTLSLLVTIHDTKKEKKKYALIVLGIVMLYWCYVYVLRGASGTYPYSIWGVKLY